MRFYPLFLTLGRTPAFIASAPATEFSRQLLGAIT
jgi:hypothetical protein